MQLYVCTSLSLSVLLSLALSPSLFLSLLLTQSLSPSLLLPWYLPFGSARLQLSRGALRMALGSPQDYITMRLRIYLLSLPLSLSLTLFLPLSYSPGRRHLTS